MLDQRRHRADLPLPAPRPPGRPDRGVDGAGIRQVVRVERRPGPRADRSEHARRSSSCSAAPPARRTTSATRPPRRSGRSWSTSSTRIGTVGQSPALMGVRLVSNKLGNIPARICIAQHCRTPRSSHPETLVLSRSRRSAALPILGEAMRRPRNALWPRGRLIAADGSRYHRPAPPARRSSRSGRSRCSPSPSSSCRPATSSTPTSPTSRPRAAMVSAEEAEALRDLYGARPADLCPVLELDQPRRASATSAWRWSGSGRSPRSSATGSG